MTKVSDDDPLGVDAGEPRRERVAAGRIDRAAELGARQHDLRDDGEHQRQHDDGGDAEDAAGLQFDEELRHRRDVGAAGEDEGEAAADGHRGQRRDQRRDLQLGHREAVDEADAHAGEQSAARIAISGDQP